MPSIQNQTQSQGFISVLYFTTLLRKLQIPEGYDVIVIPFSYMAKMILKLLKSAIV